MFPKCQCLCTSGFLSRLGYPLFNDTQLLVNGNNLLSQPWETIDVFHLFKNWSQHQFIAKDDNGGWLCSCPV